MPFLLLAAADGSAGHNRLLWALAWRLAACYCALVVADCVPSVHAIISPIVPYLVVGMSALHAYQCVPCSLLAEKRVVRPSISDCVDCVVATAPALLVYRTLPHSTCSTPLIARGSHNAAAHSRWVC